MQVGFWFLPFKHGEHSTNELLQYILKLYTVINTVNK